MAVAGTLLENKKIGLMLELGYPEVFEEAAKQGTPLANFRTASNYGDDYFINSNGKITSSTLDYEIQGKVLINKAPFPFQWKMETKFDFKPSELVLVSTSLDSMESLENTVYITRIFTIFFLQVTSRSQWNLGHKQIR